MLIIDAQRGFAACIESTHAMAFEVNALSRELRWFSVQEERQPAWLSTWLVRDSVRTHGCRNGSVQAHACRKLTVLVGVWRRCRHGRLAGLNLHSIPVAQEGELTGGLEVVALPIHCVDVRISDIHATIDSADLEPEDGLVFFSGAVGRGDVDVLVARRVPHQRGVGPVPVSSWARSRGDDRPFGRGEAHRKTVAVKEGAVALGGPGDGCVHPRAMHIDIRLFLSVIKGCNHQLADHASHVVKENVAVEQPTAHRAAERHAVSELAVIESNPDRERVIGQQIDGVPELPVGPGVGSLIG